MTENKFDVIGPDGTVITRLNSKLAERQGVSDDELQALRFSHQMRWSIFEAAKNTMNTMVLQLYANMFEALEYEQQELWHFPRDKNFHRWFAFPVELVTFNVKDIQNGVTLILSTLTVLNGPLILPQPPLSSVNLSVGKS